MPSIHPHAHASVGDFLEVRQERWMADRRNPSSLCPLPSARQLQVLLMVRTIGCSPSNADS